MTERVGFSPGRVGVIALNTFIESVRQKVFNILLLVALVIIASASFFSQFTFGEQLKFVKDFCMGAISVFGAVIAIVGTSQLIPNELENRTLYTILAKPVRRLEFLLGKFSGSVLLVFLSLAMMSLMFGGALVFKEQRLVAEATHNPSALDEPLPDAIQRIHAEARDPDIAKAVLLTFVKLVLLAAVTLFVSTFSTSMVFNVSVAVMFFFVGHLRAGASEMWAQHKWVVKALEVIPDLGKFNLADDIILGHAIPWTHVGEVVVYGLVYTAVAVAAAQLAFSDREV